MANRIHILLPTIRPVDCAGQIESVLGEQGISPGRWTMHVCANYSTVEGRAMLWRHVNATEYGVEIDDHDKILPGSLARLEAAIDWAEDNDLRAYLYAETWHNGRTNVGRSFTRGMWAKGLRAMRRDVYEESGGLRPEDAPAESYATALRAEESGVNMIRVVGCVLHLNYSDGKMADKSSFSALEKKARELCRASKKRRHRRKCKPCYDFDGNGLVPPKEQITQQTL